MKRLVGVDPIAHQAQAIEKVGHRKTGAGATDFEAL